MSFNADWLIGSYPNLEAQSFTVTSGGAEVCQIAAGNYYLFDDLSTHDLLDKLVDAINTHSAISDCDFTFQENRIVRIFASVAFALTWPSDGILRDLLGFTGNLGSATSHTAPRISPLLWSPGKKTTWEARVGTDGIPVRDIAVGQSGPGTVRATSFNRYRKNTAIYRYVENARVWTTAEANGEFFTFFDQVLAERRRFKVWRNVPEGTTTAVIDLAGDSDGPQPATGAYIYSGGSEMPWGREFGFVDSLHPITLPVVTTREYDA